MQNKLTLFCESVSDPAFTRSVEATPATKVSTSPAPGV